MGFISSQLISAADTKELRESFKAFDENGDGKLSKQELINGYARFIGLEAAKKEADEIMENVDIDESGFIDYSEFVQATMNRNKLLSK